MVAAASLDDGWVRIAHPRCFVPGVVAPALNNRSRRALDTSSIHGVVYPCSHLPEGEGAVDTCVERLIMTRTHSWEHRTGG